MRRTIIIIVAIAFTFIGSLSLLTWTQRFPHFGRLVECDKPVVRCSFVCPPGDSFNFALGFPNTTNIGAMNYPDLSGTLEISCEGNQVVSVAIPTKKALFPTWLNEDDHVAGYGLIYPNGDRESISKILKPNKLYQMTVTFSKLPPSSTELWFVWRQSRLETLRKGNFTHQP
jgi:hypothetical protein